MPEADWHQTNKIKKKTLFSLHFYFCLQFPSTQEVTLYPVVRQNGAMRRKKKTTTTQSQKKSCINFQKRKIDYIKNYWSGTLQLHTKHIHKATEIKSKFFFHFPKLCVANNFIYNLPNTKLAWQIVIPKYSTMKIFLSLFFSFLFTVNQSKQALLPNENPCQTSTVKLSHNHPNFSTFNTHIMGFLAFTVITYLD